MRTGDHRRATTWPWSAAAAVLFVALLAPAASVEPPPTPESIVREVWQLVHDHFLDPEFNGVDWAAAGRRYEEQARSVAADEDVAAVVNGMLAELDTSHTRYFTSDTPEYYQLLDVFSSAMQRWIREHVAPDGVVSYPGIGLVTREMDGRHFVVGKIDGTPAARSLIALGDAIVAVDGKPYRPLLSFRRSVGKPLRITVQRTAHAGSRRDVEVTPERLQPSEMFRSAIRASARTERRGELRIAYVHVWSYAGEAYQRELEDQLRSEQLRDADALVLDVRDGWGGASPQYLNLFNRNIPLMRFRSRDGEWRTFDTQWRKPVVLLVNEGTRSGKEVLAYGFRAYGIGPVVGTRTAGAVTAGKLHSVTGGGLLYLAGSDVTVDGERLEGVGVEPDVHVPFDVRFAAGRDPQLDRALEVAAEEVRAVRDPQSNTTVLLP